MQAQISVPIPVTRSAVMVVDGYGIRVHVRGGHLIVEDGIGRSRRQARLARPSGLRRLVLVGHTGYVSLDALRFIDDIGAAFVHLDPDGRVLVASAGYGLDDPRLRRAQAHAFGSPTGIAIARALIRHKLAGQAGVAASLGATEVIATIERAAAALDDATTPAELMVPEAAAAAAYWSAWSTLQPFWATQDASKIPDHWRTFGSRASPLTGNPRLAANPPNALLSYCYSLLEAAARLSCLAMGLDPGLGVLHADQRARDSLALDIQESGRPEVDAFVLELLRARTFRAADFHETRQGVCRVLAPLTHELAAMLPVWESLMAPVVESVARAFAAGPDSRVGQVPTTLTGARRSAGRAARRHGERQSGRPRVRLSSTCRACGETVPTGRAYCGACLPASIKMQGQAFGRAAAERLGAPAGDGPETWDRRGRCESTRRKDRREPRG